MAVFAADPAKSARAERAYDAHEWASAQALYYILADTDTAAAVHARLIVAGEMRGDTAATVKAVENALAKGVDFRNLASLLGRNFRALGRGDIYGSTMQRLQTDMPYLRRPIDRLMLDYATSRGDGADMMLYAGRLLAGLPDNARYADAYAWGALYCGCDSIAENTWRRAVDANPTDFHLLVNLGSFLADRNPGQALQYLNRAAAINPTAALKALIKSVNDKEDR